MGQPPLPPTSRLEVTSEPTGSPGLVRSLVTVTLLSSLTPRGVGTGPETVSEPSNVAEVMLCDRRDGA